MLGVLGLRVWALDFRLLAFSVVWDVEEAPSFLGFSSFRSKAQDPKVHT